MSKYTEPWMGYPILLSTMRFTYSMISGMYSLTRVRTLGGRQPSASMSWKKSAWGGGGGGAAGGIRSRTLVCGSVHDELRTPPESPTHLIFGSVGAEDGGVGNVAA